MVSVTQPVFAIQYTNYTSDKYQIEFQYPTDWILKEKTNRFEAGSEISISDANIGTKTSTITVGYDKDLFTAFGSADLQRAFNTFYQGLTSTYKYDTRVIEPPSYLTIDNQSTGSFLMTFEQKYETYPVTLAIQYWITFVGDHGYTFAFISNPEEFDSPSNTEIRDHFIKSINFLNATTNNTVSHIPNRFEIS